MLLWLLPLAVFVVVILVIKEKISRKMKKFSQTFFGTDDFMEGWNRQADVLAETPKSVSSMTRLMEPQIMRDFPEFSWDEFRAKAENMLKSALLAISEENPNLLVEASEDVQKQVVNRIADNTANGIKENYGEIRIHQTEIANYSKANGKCIITIQSAVGYLHYMTRDGKVISGDRNRMTQTKYNVELVYIQNPNAREFDNAVGTVCPNCGAPVTSLGAKFCEYCGLAVTPLNIKVWSLHKFYEVDYNRS